LPLEKSRTIRSWGTSDGLGQLTQGPTDQTVLDAEIAREVVPVRAILRVIDVEQAPWEARFGE